MGTVLGTADWVPLPRFEITQASGKKRPIDDGSKFGHNQAAGFVETIECCTAVQPALHVRLLHTHMRDRIPRAAFCLETGGEDMPDAYRLVPANPSEHKFNIVGVRCAKSGEAKYQVMYGRVFGKARCPQDPKAAGRCSPALSALDVVDVLR